MPDLVPLPSDYGPWLAELKSRIHAAQQQAARNVNRELVLLYWQIGRGILERQGREGLGIQGDRAAGAGSAQCLPRHEGVLAEQPQVHAGVRPGLA